MKSLNIANSITNLALFGPSHDIKIKLITLLHSNSRFFFFFFLKFLSHLQMLAYEISFIPTNVSLQTKTKNKKKQKKKQNKTKTKTKNKKQKQKQKKTKTKTKPKRKRKQRKKKLKQIWYNLIRLFQSSLSIPIGWCGSAKKYC